MSRERLTVLAGGMLRYRYRAGGCMDFSFHLLSEVGAPYQPWFRDQIERRGLTVEFGRDIDQKPWCADFVTNRNLIRS